MLLTKLTELFSENTSLSRNINKFIILNLLILGAILILFHFSNLDLVIQNYFYSNTHGWAIDRGNEELKLLLYVIPKKIITYFCGLILLICLYYSFIPGQDKNLIRAKKTLLYIFLSLLITLTSVPMLKQATNMHCPDSTEVFGRDKPYIKLFQKFPEEYLADKRGKCFPAGHASAGFSLLTFFFILRQKKHRILCLIMVLTLGWIMGAYQIMRGAHYISDTLITMMIALISPLLCYKFIFKATKARKETKL